MKEAIAMKMPAEATRNQLRHAVFFDNALNVKFRVFTNRQSRLSTGVACSVLGKFSYLCHVSKQKTYTSYVNRCSTY
jgi:hypothetical protein